MTFQEKLANLKQRIEGGMPAENVEIMHQATRELEASGIQKQVLKVGQPVPDFSLPNQEGVSVNIQDLYVAGPVVITFYRGIWCPYCNLDLTNLKRYHATIQDAGGTMISISLQLPKHSASIVQRHKLPFDLLFDQSNAVAAQFGLKFAYGEALKTLYRDKLDIDLAVYNNNDSWTLPMPARFLVDGTGIIRYAESSPDYTQRPDPDDLLDVLHKLQLKPSTI